MTKPEFGHAALVPLVTKLELGHAAQEAPASRLLDRLLNRAPHLS